MFLHEAFFDRDPREVARDLLGMHLVRTWHEHEMTGLIVEVEVYLAEDNLITHAKRGPMHPVPHYPETPGCLYVHAMHHHTCVNIITGEGGSVMLRELHPLKGISDMRRWRGVNCPVGNLANGPGKLCQALAIDRKLNGLSVSETAAEVRIRKMEEIADGAVQRGARVSLPQQPGHGLRFFIKKPMMAIF